MFTHYPLVAILGVFAVTAMALPTLIDVPILDDWAYSVPARTLLERGRMEIPEIISVNAVFEGVWGYLFGGLFGLSFGVLRVSTLILVALGALALYGVCRRAGVSEGWSSVGVAVYLFNGLAFALSYSYMTDQHTLPLMLMGLYLFARATEGTRREPWWLLAGAIVCGFAYLSRTHGVLVPLAAAAWIISSQRERRIRALALSLIPVAVVVLMHSWWISQTQGGFSAAQRDFSSALREMTIIDGATFAFTILFVGLMYLGFFLFPLLPLISLALVQRVPRPDGQWRRFSAVLLAVLLLSGVALRGEQMPFGAQWFGSSGSVATDLSYFGPAPSVLGMSMAGVITILSLVSAIMVTALMVLLPWKDAPPVVKISCWGLALTVISVLPSAAIFRPSIPDRYWLPLLPLALVVILWVIKTSLEADGRRRVLWLTSVMLLVASGLFAVGVTRDGLEVHRTAWSLAERAVANGMPLNQLDGGVGWNGFHFGEQVDDVSAKERLKVFREGGTLLDLFAPQIEPRFVISLAAVPGYEVREVQPVRRWLWSGPSAVYLLERKT